jgi:prepilin-type N-terminal cleavage/methylation domain-containing protein
MIARDSARGFSYLEVMIALAIFSMVMAAVIGIEQSGRRLDRKLEAKDTVYRSAVKASAFLQHEISNALVIGTSSPTNPNTKLIYRLPLLGVTGQPSPDARGNLLFGVNEVTLELEPGGRFIRVENGEIRKITDLGNDGDVRFVLQGSNPPTDGASPLVETEFEWRQDYLAATLRASTVTGNPEKDATHTLELEFYLRNQHLH